MSAEVQQAPLDAQPAADKKTEPRRNRFRRGKETRSVSKGPTILGKRNVVYSIDYEYRIGQFCLSARVLTTQNPTHL